MSDTETSGKGTGDTGDTGQQELDASNLYPEDGEVEKNYEWVERTPAKTPSAVQTVVNVCKNITEQTKCTNHGDICSWNDSENKCNAREDYQERLEGYEQLLLEGQRVKTIKDNINEIDDIVDKIKNDDQMYKKKDIEKIYNLYPSSIMDIISSVGFVTPLQLSSILLIINISSALSYIKSVFNLINIGITGDIVNLIIQTKVLNYLNSGFIDDLKSIGSLISNTEDEIIRRIEDTYNINNGDLIETINLINSNSFMESTEDKLREYFDGKTEDITITYEELIDVINDIDMDVTKNIDQTIIDSPLYLDVINSTIDSNIESIEQIETKEDTQSETTDPADESRGDPTTTSTDDSSTGDIQQDISLIDTMGGQTSNNAFFDNDIFNKTADIIKDTASFLALGVASITSVGPTFIVGLAMVSISIAMFKNYTNSKLGLMEIMGFSNINVYQHLMTLLKICIKLNIDATYIINDILFEDSEKQTKFNRTINKACILLRERITKEWNRRIDLSLTKYLVSDKRGFYYNTVCIKSINFVEAHSDESINGLNGNNLHKYMKMLGIDYVENTENTEYIERIKQKHKGLSDIYSNELRINNEADDTKYIGAYITLSIKDIDFDRDKMNINDIPDIDNPTIFLNNYEIKEMISSDEPINTELTGKEVNFMISKEKYRKIELINSLNKQYRIFYPNENRNINKTTIKTNDIHFFNFYCLQEQIFNLPKPINEGTNTVEETYKDVIKNYLEYPFKSLTPEKTINQTYRDFIKFLKTYSELEILIKDDVNNTEKIQIIKKFILSDKFTGIGYLKNAGSSILTYSKKLLRLVGEITVVAVAVPTVISGAIAGVTVGATAKGASSLLKTTASSIATQTIPDLGLNNKEITKVNFDTYKIKKLLDFVGDNIEKYKKIKSPEIDKSIYKIRQKLPIKTLLYYYLFLNNIELKEGIMPKICIILKNIDTAIKTGYDMGYTLPNLEKGIKTKNTDFFENARRSIQTIEDKTTKKIYKIPVPYITITDLGFKRKQTNILVPESMVIEQIDELTKNVEYQTKLFTPDDYKAEVKRRNVVTGQGLSDSISKKVNKFAEVVTNQQFNKKINGGGGELYVDIDRHYMTKNTTNATNTMVGGFRGDLKKRLQLKQDKYYKIKPNINKYLFDAINTNYVNLLKVRQQVKLDGNDGFMNKILTEYFGGTIDIYISYPVNKIIGKNNKISKRELEAVYNNFDIFITPRLDSTGTRTEETEETGELEETEETEETRETEETNSKNKNIAKTLNEEIINRRSENNYDIRLVVSNDSKKIIEETVIKSDSYQDENKYKNVNGEIGEMYIKYDSQGDIIDESDESNVTNPIFIKRNRNTYYSRLNNNSNEPVADIPNYKLNSDTVNNKLYNGNVVYIIENIEEERDKKELEDLILQKSEIEERNTNPLFAKQTKISLDIFKGGLLLNQNTNKVVICKKNLDNSVFISEIIYVSKILFNELKLNPTWSLFGNDVTKKTKEKQQYNTLFILLSEFGDITSMGLIQLNNERNFMNINTILDFLSDKNNENFGVIQDIETLEGELSDGITTNKLGKKYLSLNFNYEIFDSIINKKIIKRPRYKYISYVTFGVRDGNVKDKLAYKLYIKTYNQDDLDRCNDYIFDRLTDQSNGVKRSRLFQTKGIKRQELYTITSIKRSIMNNYITLISKYDPDKNNENKLNSLDTSYRNIDVTDTLQPESVNSRNRRGGGTTTIKRTNRKNKKRLKKIRTNRKINNRVRTNRKINNKIRTNKKRTNRKRTKQK